MIVRLITRRSQVQILSPPPKVTPGQRLFPEIVGKGFYRLFYRFVINLSSRFKPEFSRD